MTAGGEMQDRFLGLAIDSSLRRKIVALARVRCLPFKEKLRSLRKGLDEEYFDELAFAVGESE